MIPKFLQSVGVSKLNGSVISNTLSLLGYEVSEQKVNAIMDLVNIVASENPSLTIGDLMADEQFIAMIKSLRSGAGAGASDGFGQCPYCGRTGKLSEYAPKLFNKEN